MRALILRFLYIGLFAVGGGLSAISLIQREIVERLGWLTAETLVDILAIAEMTPGPIAVNAASFVGMSLYGLPGAAAATLACILPGCLISFAVSKANDRLRSSARWRCALGLLRAAVVGVIVNGGLVIVQNALFPQGGPLDPMALACAAVGVLVYRRRRPSPMAFLLAMGTVCGLLRLAVLELGA